MRRPAQRMELTWSSGFRILGQEMVVVEVGETKDKFSVYLDHALQHFTIPQDCTRRTSWSYQSQEARLARYLCQNLQELPELALI